MDVTTGYEKNLKLISLSMKSRIGRKSSYFRNILDKAYFIIKVIEGNRKIM